MQGWERMIKLTSLNLRSSVEFSYNAEERKKENATAWLKERRNVNIRSIEQFSVPTFARSYLSEMLSSSWDYLYVYRFDIEVRMSNPALLHAGAFSG
jgi:hypothetical protein